jgi:ankyrin repeat protein
MPVQNRSIAKKRASAVDGALAFYVAKNHLFSLSKKARAPGTLRAAVQMAALDRGAANQRAALAQKVALARRLVNAASVTDNDRALFEIALLLSQGTNPRWAPDALSICLAAGNFAAARLLLSHGAPVNARQEKQYRTEIDGGHTPLYYALIHGSVGEGEIDELLAAGAKPGMDPGMISDWLRTYWQYSWGRDRRVVEKLLDAGCPVDGRGKDGRTALWHACDGQDDPTVRMLLGRGADPKLVPQLVTMYIDNANMLKWLLKRGLSPEGDPFYQEMWFGVLGSQLPLTLAVIRRQWRSVMALLEAGADPKRDRSMALLWACGNEGNIDVVNALLRRGANPNDRYPLTRAAGGGRADIVAALLKKGADPNRAAGRVHTPLYEAVVKESLPVARALVGAGASVTPSIRRIPGMSSQMARFIDATAAAQRAARMAQARRSPRRR